MFVSKLVANSRHLLGRIPSPPLRAAARGCHIVAVPPRNRVPTGELVVMGAMLAVSLWAVPFWVLYHIPDYQNEDRNQYTGK